MRSVITKMTLDATYTTTVALKFPEKFMLSRKVMTVLLAGLGAAASVLAQAADPVPIKVGLMTVKTGVASNPDYPHVWRMRKWHQDLYVVVSNRTLAESLIER